MIQNYAATDFLPRHLGSKYIIHGVKFYAPWDPKKTKNAYVDCITHNTKGDAVAL